MYLSRLTLSRKPDIAALGQLLEPEHQGRRMDAHHRLIWSAFAGNQEARRDFLWRDMGRGQFLVLSPRAPGESALFEEIDAKPFAPDLRPGDSLKILLRANAARTVTDLDGRKRHRDVVMEELHRVPKEQRADARMGVAQKAGRHWLEGQGARAGFKVETATVNSYLVSEPRRKGPRFGIIDLEGGIEIADPEAFLARIAQGFGRAKAFGCGLMLIRRE